jgi:hypothetical protein
VFLLPLEGFDKTLLSQVLIPQLGELLVLPMKLGVIGIVAVGDEA